MTPAESNFLTALAQQVEDNGDESSAADMRILAAGSMPWQGDTDDADDADESGFDDGVTTYTVTIVETVHHYVDVKADTPGAARVKVRNAMRLPGWADPRHSDVQGSYVSSAIPQP